MDRLRNADHGEGSNWAEVPAVERRKIGRAQEKRFALDQHPALRPGSSGRPSRSARSTAATDFFIHGADMLRCHRTDTFEQRMCDGRFGQRFWREIICYESIIRLRDRVDSIGTTGAAL